ncbi:unnamed protein product [Effrenium voratum]|uniref:Uncharacterized protein n=1 Tax=Effrenium voratum TaxID=2562239 RepID=A0AA36IH64_9DINO|nr:unnamed protein product [Effrenium voratum]CAJ1435835.1 unnamed protein product [Effrenium voratum]
MSSTQALQRTATKDRLPPIKRGRGKLLTANLEHVEETGSQRSQNSARHELPDGFSLIHYIHAKVATMDGKKARFDMEFLKKSLQCLDKRQLNEKEEVFGYTSLSLACSVGHDQVVHLLLADAAAKCNLGNTALHLAARGGHASVVQKLMMHGAAVGAQNKEGWTPLIWAAMNGRGAVVDALLEKAQATSVDNQGMTALMWATRHGHVDIMKSILATGPDLNFQDLDGHTVMYHAKQHRAARKMLQQFEELNRRLLTSAKSGDVTEASLALEAGAFVDALDSEGASPLLLAASQRHLPMVKLLARHGADLSLEASRAASPWLRNYEFRTSIQEVLRDAVKSNRLLTHSAKEGDWEGVMQAISLGAWPDLPDESQKTALSWAASHGSVDAVRELLQARASINTRDTCGWTAVHWAAHNNWAQVASVLKFHGADVHAKAYTGDTAVHLAAKSWGARSVSEVPKSELSTLTLFLWKVERATVQQAQSFANGAMRLASASSLISLGEDVDVDVE